MTIETIDNLLFIASVIMLVTVVSGTLFGVYQILARKL